jgi:two-component system sensor histidine kinase PilS (NtrC family)
VLINLLDNARRFSSGQKDTIQVYLTPVSAAVAPDTVRLSVWSYGEPLEPSVEQHLFEPFFSSDSRSSGLGLYICRELCASHAATMAYDRSQRFVGQQSMSGNEFSVQLRTHPATNLSAS